MCLAIVRSKVERRTSGIGYKVMRLTSKGWVGQVKGSHPPYPARIGKRITRDDQGIIRVRPAITTTCRYRSGFHIWLDVDDAIQAKRYDGRRSCAVVVVKWSVELARGKQRYEDIGSCVVSKHMTIVRKYKKPPSPLAMKRPKRKTGI